jgi:hypothetical protein
MHVRCISCHSFLGRNDALEQFPVGRRLAFDPENGRLWVLCRSCRQWNLTPIEDRWEAVEAAEKLFEGAAIGATTDNVAFGRVQEGTELIRIGQVDRPEMAAWRYGDQLLRRWRRHKRSMQISMGLGAVIGSVPVLGGGVASAGFAILAGGILVRDRQAVMRTAEGHVIRRGDGGRALLVPGDRVGSWKVVVPRLRNDDLTLEGDEALLALRRLLPRVNLKGGHPDEVRNATDEILRVGDSRLIMGLAAVDLEDTSTMDDRGVFWRKRPHRIAAGHPVLKLALEMAVNDETERRALDGEVALLEREWREAEELAAIADDLVFPSGLRERLGRLKERRGPTFRSGVDSG